MRSLILLLALFVGMCSVSTVNAQQISFGYYSYPQIYRPAPVYRPIFGFGGYNRGYNGGFNQGHHGGFNQGYHQGHFGGFHQGFNQGHHGGFHQGFHHHHR
jgi:hypothetical protein